jgi:transcriptional regulator with XRE-family HTH domain
VPARPTPAAMQLAHRLRQLREEKSVTQAALATAFSAEQQVGSATVSSWENVKQPSTPSESRLEPYARFFATDRSLVGDPHLLPLRELDAEERDRHRELKSELRGLWEAAHGRLNYEAPPARRSWYFNDPGPVTIVCPDATDALRGPLASPRDPNYTSMHAYADLDALIELHGHLRAENSLNYGVFHKLASKVRPDDLAGHVVLLGGLGLNRQLMRGLAHQLPILQVVDPNVQTGEIFVVLDGESEQRFYTIWSPYDETELMEDVALLARVANPYNQSRTLSICNGIHSRGVLGAVRSLTDALLRDANETYIAERFPDREFALLLRVPVVQGEAMTPDIANPETRLFEWPAKADKTLM